MAAVDAELLYLAMAAPIGIVVETSDFNLLQARLQPIRKKNPDFEILAFVRSPINMVDMWILKKRIPREIVDGAES